MMDKIVAGGGAMLRGHDHRRARLSFKPKTDDLRDSVGTRAGARRCARGARKVRAFDPVAMEARGAPAEAPVDFCRGRLRRGDGRRRARSSRRSGTSSAMLDLRKLHRLLRRPGLYRLPQHLRCRRPGRNVDRASATPGWAAGSAGTVRHESRGARRRVAGERSHDRRRDRQAAPGHPRRARFPDGDPPPRRSVLPASSGRPTSRWSTRAWSRAGTTTSCRPTTSASSRGWPRSCSTTGREESPTHGRGQRVLPRGAEPDAAGDPAAGAATG